VADAAGRLADPVPDRIEQVAMVLRVVGDVVRRGMMSRGMMRRAVRCGGLSWLRRRAHLPQA
jgi:hypothetical protein